MDMGDENEKTESKEEWVTTTVKIAPTSLPDDSNKTDVDVTSSDTKEIPASTSPLPVFKNSNSSSVMHPALKKSISDVLRKNMTQEKKQESGSNKSEEDSLDPLNKIPQTKISSATDSKSFSISNLLKPDASIKSGGARKRFCYSVGLAPEASAKITAETPLKEDSESADQKADIKPKLDKGSKVLQVKAATSDDSFNQGGIVRSTIKVKRKRHFKGGTYGLYFSRKSKKKLIKKGDSNSRDDEVSLASTENGSGVDSEDANSLFSDFTPSEVSFADDEICSSSRCSPILPPDSHTDIVSKDQSSLSETQNSNSQICNNKSETTFPTFSHSNDSNNSNNVKTTSENDTKDSHPLSPVLVENRPIKIEIDDESLIDSNSSKLLNSVESVVKKQDSARKTFRSNLPKTKITSATEEKSLPKTGFKFRALPKRSCTENSLHSDSSQDFEKYEERSRKPNSVSTIATSVKSRQRMRRKFAEDVVDTDLGLLSINTINTIPTKLDKKAKLDPSTHQSVTISDIVSNFSEFADKIQYTPRTKSISKAEFIFNPKKPPLSNCCCWEEGISLTVRDNQPTVFCQAVDSVDDKLVGCCNAVRSYPLVRTSPRTPFTVMCDMHLWRLKNHHCCPRCSRFCTQGPYMRCSGFGNSGKVYHLFHEQCLGETERSMPFCLHCGNESKLKVIQLEINLSSAPSCLSYSDYYKTAPAARMTFSGPNKNKIKNGKTSKLSNKSADWEPCVDSMLPVAEQRILENMLLKINEIRKEDIPDYPIHELYTAAIEGSAIDVLYMMARGVSPDAKFSEKDNDTALHAAAKSGNVIIAHLLVEAGCCIDSFNDLLQTPVMIATEKNQVGIVEYLVYRKADVDLQGEAGMTCLHVASKNGNIELCNALLRSSKIDLNLQDDGGWTSVVWASEHGHAEIVQLLLEKGSNPNIRDKEGNTALHWAAFNGNPTICDLALRYGCNINEVNVHGDTPLHIAARQDNSTCVELLLSMRAFTDVKNKVQQLPMDCCGSESASRRALQLNAMLVQLLKRAPTTIERIVSNDISHGKEKIPIQCVNWFDNENLISKDFLYVIENCETMPIKMDRSITALNTCDCTTECMSPNCICANVSFKCWYDKDGRLCPEFNMCDPPMLFECNRACTCDASSCRNRVVQKGLICRLQLFRTAGKGWGVRTLKDIPKGTFICEYVGELISDSEADKREDDSYLFDLDNRDGDTYCLDARHFGNISRFINHLCEPNLVPVKVFVDHQDLSFPRIAFFSTRDIAQYEELGFDYGEKFWIIKSKWFTCNCASPGCKYSSETIHETLANYHKKDKEEQNES